MNSYTIYNAAQGNVLRIMSCDEAMLLNCIGPGEGYITGVVDAKTKLVVNGEVIDKPASVLEAARLAECRSQTLTRRGMLLTSSDWTVLQDVPMPAATRALWATYRQALRDLPEQAGFPDGVVWPSPPGA